jgi:hypothetical protein
MVDVDTALTGTGDQMTEHLWIRLLPWRKRTQAKSKSAQIKFAPELKITHNDGWICLELHLVNRSSRMVWVEEACVGLADLDANLQAATSAGEAKLKICQSIGPKDELSVSLARTIYDAAGRPQGRYSCLVITNVHYRVFDEWCDAKLETCFVEMAALSVLGLRRADSHDKKTKQVNGLVDLTTHEHQG